MREGLRAAGVFPDTVRPRSDAFVKNFSIFTILEDGFFCDSTALHGTINKHDSRVLLVTVDWVSSIDTYVQFSFSSVTWLSNRTDALLSLRTQLVLSHSH